MSEIFGERQGTYRMTNMGFHAQTLEIFEAGWFGLRAVDFGPWMDHLDQLSRK